MKLKFESSFISYECMHDVTGSLTGTYYVTMHVDVAIKLYREIHPDRQVSDFVALDGFMTERKARFVRPPELMEVRNLKDICRDYVRDVCGGSMKVASSALGLHPDTIHKVLSGAKKQLPTHTLKRLGLYEDSRLYSLEVK